MILVRILKRDLIRSRTAGAVVFSFIFLSAVLMAGGVQLALTISGAVSSFFEAAAVPDVVQLHAGELDREHLESWVRGQELVQKHQVVEMLTIDGDALYLSGSGTSEKNSVMDISLVRQNTEFDFLLDRDNRVYYPGPGEIGVPVYYAERDGIAVGDPVVIRTGDAQFQFTVGAIVRDAQMNPSIIHSKRFVLHGVEYETLREIIPEAEYLIGFVLNDPEQSNEFMSMYQDAGLPQGGPLVDKNLFVAFNALSDGVVAAVLIVLSLLLILIAMLCLRLTILASIEEDYQDIGVMKAIGMDRRVIRRLHMMKYLLIGVAAVTAGYLASYPLASIPAAQVAVYMGTPAPSPASYIAPAAGALLVLFILLLSCLVILRRINAVSAVSALRGEGGRERVRTVGVPGIRAFGAMNLNLVLGLRDVVQRVRLYLLLAVIFAFATFTIIVPVHFLSTMSSDEFVSYMGVGRSDIRIDLRQTDNMAARFEQVVSTLHSDTDVERFAPLVTSQFTHILPGGVTETLSVETGNIALFPVDYLEGAAPTRDDEIALSYLNAQDMDVEPGDTVVLFLNDVETELTVSGLYQDVTNGGRTAKGTFAHDPDNVVWYSVAVDLWEGVPIQEKAALYATAFAPARVTDLAGYLEQTLGTTIGRLTSVTRAAILVGLGISALITALFLNMLIRKDAGRNAILRSLGFTVAHLRSQYLATTLSVLAVGVMAGTLFANTLGQQVVSLLWSLMGAAQIRFVIDPFNAYVILPLLFAAVVAITTRAALSGINNTPGVIR